MQARAPPSPQRNEERFSRRFALPHLVGGSRGNGPDSPAADAILYFWHQAAGQGARWKSPTEVRQAADRFKPSAVA